MLTRDGTVKVLHSGTSGIVHAPDETWLTSTGVSVGTARSMTPEQYQAKQVTQAADHYAQRCALYEMPVGVPLLTSESAYKLADRHVNRSRRRSARSAARPR